MSVHKIHPRGYAGRVLAAAAAALTLSGCIGPLLAGRSVHLGRAFALERLRNPSNEGFDGLPLKESRMHRVIAYVVEGECDPLEDRTSTGTAPEGCHVRVADLGVMSLPVETPTLVLRYRGGAFAPATLSLALNENSTLRSLSIVGAAGTPGLLIRFGPMGPGVR